MIAGRTCKVTGWGGDGAKGRESTPWAEAAGAYRQEEAEFGEHRGTGM